MNLRVRSLIVAHLLACGGGEASTSTSAQPPGVSTAPGPASAATDAGAKKRRGDPCHAGDDCENGGCMMDHPGATVGRCAPVPIPGRALVIDGSVQLAHCTHTPGASGHEVAHLREAARTEHASIAAFARTIAELMALGAPLALLFDTQRAMADEIRHTERTLDLLERFTGQRPKLGPLPAATASLARPVGELFRDVLRGGAIGETEAAEDAERRRLAATDEELRAYYDMIVIDESRHAALAVRTLRWLADHVM